MGDGGADVLKREATGLGDARRADRELGEPSQAPQLTDELGIDARRDVEPEQPLARELGERDACGYGFGLQAFVLLRREPDVDLLRQDARLGSALAGHVRVLLGCVLGASGTGVRGLAPTGERV